MSFFKWSELSGCVRWHLNLFSFVCVSLGDLAVRCTAVDVELKRSSGQLLVNASWDVESDVTKYLVKWREYFIDNFKNASWTVVSHRL